MSGVDPKRVDALFRKVCDLTAEQRALILDQECADQAELRAQVEELVGHYPDVAEESQTLRDFQGAACRMAFETVYAQIGASLPKYIRGYRLLDVAGIGGMGIVVRAEQQDPRRLVAFKFMHPGRVDTDSRRDHHAGLLRRFERERKALTLLAHPAIAQIYDAGIHRAEAGRAQPYFVMEYVDGESLLAFAVGLSQRQRLALLATVCDAVDYAHQRGVIHRDLKPANILVTREGQPKVLDFGLARLLNVDATRSVSEPGQALGTLAYCSPEQCRGGDVDARADVYALGVLGFELLTGRLPHDIAHKSPAEVIDTICKVDALGLNAVLPEVDDDLATLVARALEMEPSRRYASARALAADIRSWLVGEPIVARPLSRFERWRRRIKCHRGRLTAVAVVVSVIGITLWVNSKLYRQIEALAHDYGSLATSSQTYAEVSRFASLTGQMEEMWPADPARISRYEGWLKDALDLQGRAALQRETLEGLRARALPWNEAEQRDDRETHPRFGEWARLRDEIGALEADRDRLAAQLDRPSLWSFADEADAAEYAGLSSLMIAICNIDDPTDGFLADVRRWLVLAEHAWSALAPAVASDWSVAIESIADPSRCPDYGGLRIEPQTGLVPLGRNENTGLWEFWHLASGERPPPDGAGGFGVTAESGIVLVLLPQQHRLIGAQADDRDQPLYDSAARPDERPVMVRLAPYFIGKHETSQGQWCRISGEYPSRIGPGGYTPGLDPDLLANPVSQLDWITSRDGLERVGLTLPSEAQWEVAARAGTSTVWWTGDLRMSLTGVANLPDRSAARVEESWESLADWPEFDDGYPYMAPCGTLRANAFGLHHVHGNMLEWCRDRYGSYLLAARGGDGVRIGQWSSRRVLRGGTFHRAVARARSAWRASDIETSHAMHSGVRAARPLVRSSLTSAPQRRDVTNLNPAEVLLEAQALCDQAPDLWLAQAERLATWIERAESLVTCHERIAADLARLREPATSSVASRERHPRFVDWYDLTTRIGQRQKRLDALDEEIGRRRTYSFANPNDARWHAEQEKLVQYTERFAGPAGAIEEVKRRLEFARSVAARSIEAPEAKARWEDAIASIADPTRCPRYGGLRISPQLGLLPLGQDPQSTLWEFAHIASGSMSTRNPRDGALTLDAGSCIVLVLIPGGTVFLGEQAEDPRLPNYVPMPSGRMQTIALEPFFLAKHEITQTQWLRLAGGNPSMFAAGVASPMGSARITSVHPVDSVTWNDADRTLRRYGLILPTEAQWEHACRADGVPDWSVGDPYGLRGSVNCFDLRHLIAIGDFDNHEVTEDDGFGLHAPVYGMRPNAFGLHHMLGNVAEWCRDIHVSYDHPVAAHDGERIPVPSMQYVEPDHRMIRGGHFETRFDELRPSWRAFGLASAAIYYCGVRAARRLETATR